MNRRSNRPFEPAEAGLRQLATLVGRVTRAPLTQGNAIDPLINGDAAYPAMIAEIDAAQRSVALVTYIFDHGIAGAMFLDALERAVKRGVEVRVLIDAVGSRYSHPPVVHELRKRGVTVAKFLPSLFPVAHPFFNLRNHRKLLIVDGTTAFFGGLNIRDACMLSLKTADPTQDIHFRVRGPLVPQLMSAVVFDWHFATGEMLEGECWMAPAWGGADGAALPGHIHARGIADGPDEDFETLLLTLLGALAVARKSVRIVTPYFLPDAPLIDALEIAALRGVCVEIVLPARGNLPVVQWAQTAHLAQLIDKGVRVHLSPPPFDHSKLFIVDGEWCLIGSANWDPRSLRLNFEYVVECYSAEFAAELERVIDAKIAGARELTRAELDRRNLAVRLRDGAVWLAQPYL